MPPTVVNTIIVGGGHAGVNLACLLELQQEKNMGVGVSRPDYLILEKENTLLSKWRDQRWDNFQMNTPIIFCRLYAFGDDSNCGKSIKDDSDNSNDGDNSNNRPLTKIISLTSLDNWKEQLFASEQQVNLYDVIIIDLGHMVGNDLYMTTLSFTDEILSSLSSSCSTSDDDGSGQSPRVVLVKSKSLSSLARRLIPCQHILDGTYTFQEASTVANHEMGENSGGDRDHHQQLKQPLIISSVGVVEYRRTIPYVVRPGNSVLEVGCHYGRTTALLYDAAVVPDSLEGGDGGGENAVSGLCIGVDIGPKIIRRAKDTYPHIRFEVGDAFKTLELLKLRLLINDEEGERAVATPTSKNLGYDVVYADIGGLSGAYGTLESLSLIDALSNSLQPNYIVIKSLCMRRLATKLQPFSSIWSKKQATS